MERSDDSFEFKYGSLENSSADQSLLPHVEQDGVPWQAAWNTPVRGAVQGLESAQRRPIELARNTASAITKPIETHGGAHSAGAATATSATSPDPIGAASGSLR